MAQKKVTKLDISVTKAENISKWYTEVITKAEFVDYYKDVSGCYILRPWSYRIWEAVQAFFDGEIKKLGVEPCYFPMFVSKAALETEADHVEGFAPEVAWVTRSGNSELENPIAIRPTSETIMYPAFKTWIRSHRDLPLRLNQWTNVVRWEFKNPTPFLRTLEFLWQEGHTVFAERDEADREVLDILDLYARVYEELFSIPVIKGRKSDKEKFAGGDFSSTVELYIPGAGRAIQAATSHSLGQNFSKMFKIMFTDESGDADAKKYAWQNSWGLSTRSLGCLLMVHGDDKGAVLPPRVAPTQVVGIAIHKSKTSAEEVEGVKNCMAGVIEKLQKAGLRAKNDDRSDKNPGWKYNYWEQKGVPLRLEIGPNDFKEEKCVLVRRDTGEKLSAPLHGIEEFIVKLLDSIQNDMLDKARKERDERLSIVWNWEDFKTALMKGNIILAPWSLTTESEEWVKDETSKLGAEEGENDGRQLTGAAKSLCIPFNQPPLPEGTLCFTGNGLPAKEWALWGRSY